MANVFFSYSHTDEALRNELDVHLAMLRREGLIETLHDRRITAGERIDDSISALIEQSDVILCLLSPQFIASDYCYSREMKRALERHADGSAVVIPVVLRHCEWKQTPLADLRGTPRDNKPVMAWPDRDEAFLDVTKDIRAAIGKRTATTKPVVRNTPPATTPVSKTTHIQQDMTAQISGPRTANLRVRKELTDLDRDRFARNAFEFIAEFFANSLAELVARNPELDSEYTRIDARKFAASLYRKGKKVSSISVFIGSDSERSRSIRFANTDSPSDNSYNGEFSVGDHDGEPVFGNIFGAFMREEKMRFTSEEVAEAVWDRFIERAR